jgi:hypothetical protein
LNELIEGRESFSGGGFWGGSPDDDADRNRSRGKMTE